MMLPKEILAQIRSINRRRSILESATLRRRSIEEGHLSQKKKNRNALKSAIYRVDSYGDIRSDAEWEKRRTYNRSILESMNG